MGGQLLVQSCLLALAAVLATAHAQGRSLTNLVWPERQTSKSFDRKLKHKMPDLPLQDPALVSRPLAHGQLRFPEWCALQLELDVYIRRPC